MKYSYHLFVLFLFLSGMSLTAPAQSVRQAPTTPMVETAFELLPAFTYQSGSSRGEYHFFNTSIGADRYLWNFGDSTELIRDFSPTHIFHENGEYQVCLKAFTDKGFADSLCQTVTVTGMSIEQLEKQVVLSVSPNPTRGVINVDVSSLNVSGSSIKVYSIIGKELEHLDVNAVGQDVYQIDISSQVDGFYFVRVQTPKEVFTWRVALSR